VREGIVSVPVLHFPKVEIPEPRAGCELVFRGLHTAPQTVPFGSGIVGVLNLVALSTVATVAYNCPGGRNGSLCPNGNGNPEFAVGAGESFVANVGVCAVRVQTTASEAKLTHSPVATQSHSGTVMPDEVTKSALTVGLSIGISAVLVAIVIAGIWLVHARKLTCCCGDEMGKKLGSDSSGSGQFFV
jgi:hypothetical protein